MVEQFKHNAKYYDDVPLNWNCKDCIHFKFFIDGVCNGCTKRVDHKFVESYAPYFVSVPEERSGICSEFVPNRKRNGLYTWKGVEHYLVVRHRACMRAQDGYKMACWKDYLQYAQNKGLQKAYMLNGDRSSIYYGYWIDYFYGTNVENGKLKVFCKSKQVPYRNVDGIMFNHSVKKNIDGIEIPKERSDIMSDFSKALSAAQSGNKNELEAMMYKNKLNTMFVDVLNTEKHEERYGLHASAILASDNDFCYREQVLSLFFKMNQGENLPIKLLRIFAQGNAMHEKWYRMFRALGYDVAIERTLFLPEYDLNFTIDALLNLKRSGDPRDELIIDVKSQSTFAFKKQKGHPHGENQINFYMWALTKYTGIPHKKGFVLVDSKDDQEIKPVPVHWDKDKCKPFVDRLKEIQELKKVFLEEHEAPPRKCKNCDTKRAMQCNMRDACFNIGIGRVRLKTNAY